MARLKHEKHGFMDVSDGNQIADMRKNGWVDDDGSELAAKLANLGITDEVTEDAAEQTGDQQEQPKRRGRKPAEQTGD